MSTVHARLHSIFSLCLPYRYACQLHFAAYRYPYCTFIVWASHHSSCSGRASTHRNSKHPIISEEPTQPPIVGIHCGVCLFVILLAASLTFFVPFVTVLVVDIAGRWLVGVGCHSDDA